MTRYVVDASVVIKWYIPEKLSEQADLFLEESVVAGAPLLAPDLLIAEVGNILWKKQRLGELSPSEASHILETIGESLPLQLYESLSLMSSAWKIACTFDRTFYDALYVALAQQQDALFITADEKLVSALRRGQLRKRVQWLGAWKSHKHHESRRRKLS